MESAINDRSMNDDQAMNKSSVTGVPNAAVDPNVQAESGDPSSSKGSGVQRDVLGAEKTGPAPSAGEMAGYAGSDVTGGDLTAHHDAGAAMDASLQQRGAEQQMQQQQVAGEVASQTTDLKPHSANPEDGTPTNERASDDSRGGSMPDETAGTASTFDDETQKKTMNSEASATNDMTSSTRSNDEAAQNELAEANDKFLRLVAEFENFKRQAARREQETRERAARNVIEDLLPVLDNFERAVEAARTSDDFAGVRMGVEFIAQQFRDTLKGHGVEAIETQGQPFDPLKHDALEEIESDQPAGTIVNEAQRGYLYKGQVMRASRVRVAS